MNLSKIRSAVSSFFRDEEGAQVVEYALIIAVVSIALAVALSQIAANGGPFGSLITRVTACLSGGACAANTAAAAATGG